MCANVMDVRHNGDFCGLSLDGVDANDFLGKIINYFQNFGINIGEIKYTDGTNIPYQLKMQGNCTITSESCNPSFWRMDREKYLSQSSYGVPRQLLKSPEEMLSIIISQVKEEKRLAKNKILYKPTSSSVFHLVESPILTPGEIIEIVRDSSLEYLINTYINNTDVDGLVNDTCLLNGGMDVINGSLYAFKFGEIFNLRKSDYHHIDKLLVAEGDITPKIMEIANNSIN